MTITAEMKQAVERAGIEPVRLEDPQTGDAYWLVRDDVYRKIRDMAEIDHSDLSLYEYEDYRPLDENP